MKNHQQCTLRALGSKVILQMTASRFARDDVTSNSSRDIQHRRTLTGYRHYIHSVFKKVQTTVNSHMIVILIVRKFPLLPRPMPMGWIQAMRMWSGEHCVSQAKEYTHHLIIQAYYTTTVHEGACMHCCVHQAGLQYTLAVWLKTKSQKSQPHSKNAMELVINCPY